MMNQEEIQLQTNRLLTEHFGFQPITVIDDIINVINEIMYRCTEQLEQILINQKLKIDENLKNNKNNNDNNDNLNYTIEDIQTGTATLESFLEHNINRNFDKFEIYALRNIFNFPPDLITGGYIKLKNHEGLKLYDNINQNDEKINEEMIEIIQQIKYQVELNKLLCDSLPKLNKLRKISKIIKIRLKSFFENINNTTTTTNNNKILAQFMPLNDTIIFLVIELRNIFDKINSIKDLINDENLKNKFLKGSKEEEELNKRINLIIGNINNNKDNDNIETTELSKINNKSGNDIIQFFSDERNIIL